MSDGVTKCVFCKSACTDSGPLNDAREYFALDCPVCGRYFVHDTLLAGFQERQKVDTFLVNYISENIRIKRQGLIPVWKSLKAENLVSEKCVNRNVEEFANREIFHAEKPTELLRAFSEKLKGKSPFTEIKLDQTDVYYLKMVNHEELIEWLQVLLNNDLISSLQFASYLKTIGGQPNPLQHSFTVTSRGWSKIGEMFNSSNSTKAFIAMSFKHPQRGEIQGAIEDACRATGWEGITIDKEEYVGGVSDEIIAKINQSRFVIAEFSENKHGVYYEAGYAEGRNLTVIYVVKEEEMQNVHFDTKHINHITWKDTSELRTKLINRINAVINK